MISTRWNLSCLLNGIIATAYAVPPYRLKLMHLLSGHRLIFTARHDHDRSLASMIIFALDYESNQRNEKRKK